MKWDKLLEFSIIDFAGLIVSIVTLIFAYRISKGFEVKKNHTNKQFETVMALIQAINETMIVAVTDTKMGLSYSDVMELNLEDDRVVTAHTHSLWLFAHFWENEDSIFLGASIIETMPFLTFVNNPLLPKDIAYILDKFYFPTLIKKSVADERNFVALYPPNKYNGKITALYEVPKMTNAYENLGVFQNTCLELQDAIYDWLEKYGAKDLNLNLSTYAPTIRK